MESEFPHACNTPVDHLLFRFRERRRHGDLALAGKRIEGHVVAERAGHAMHTALVQKLLRDRSLWELAHGYNEVREAEPAMAGVRLQPLTA